jgi:hypothetical protein
MDVVATSCSKILVYRHIIAVQIISVSHHLSEKGDLPQAFFNKRFMT